MYHPCFLRGSIILPSCVFSCLFLPFDWRKFVLAAFLFRLKFSFAVCYWWVSSHHPSWSCTVMSYIMSVFKFCSHITSTKYEEGGRLSIRPSKPELKLTQIKYLYPLFCSLWSDLLFTSVQKRSWVRPAWEISIRIHSPKYTKNTIFAI